MLGKFLVIDISSYSCSKHYKYKFMFGTFQVITLVTIELSNNRPSNADIMRTDDCDEDIGSENLETISLILDLMGLKFQALTANRRAINFSYKKLNSL